METLSKIPSEGTWSEAATRTNENFTKISNEIKKLGTPSSVKMPLFSSLSEAQKTITRPYIGQLCLVGSVLPAPVYRWNGSSWEYTGIDGGNATAPLTDYATNEKVDSELRIRDEEISRVKTSVNNKVDSVPGKTLSSNDFTNEEKFKLQGLTNYDDTTIRNQQEELARTVANNKNETDKQLQVLNSQHKVMSETEYELLTKKEPNTIYLTYEE